MTAQPSTVLADGLTPLHVRTYDVEAFRTEDGSLLVRGALEDRKPPGVWVDRDPEALTIHRMVVELRIAFPSFTIESVDVRFSTFPDLMCPGIASHYRSLIGVSIARGFTQVVRERFGGPRGCSHVNALLLALAPVAIQCGWPERLLAPDGFDQSPAPGPGRDLRLDSCHVWERNTPVARDLLAGKEPDPPLPVARRLARLGQNADEWRAWFDGI